MTRCPFSDPWFLNEHCELEEHRFIFLLRHPGLLADPAVETRRRCAFFAVDYEPDMLEYGRAAGRTYRAGLGDWSERIRTGRVQTRNITEHAEIPSRLKKIARAWDYV